MPRRSPITPQRLGIPATIVMPVTTPFVKVAATRAYGAEVVLDGETVAEAQARAEAIARERGLILVHPYDDPQVIAGQGTIALEMLEEVPDLDVLVIPIGGGGLIAGNAIAARGDQPGDRDRRRRGGALSRRSGTRCTASIVPLGGPTLAEGIAVKNVGKLTLPIVRELVSDIVLVDEAHLERAVNAYLTLQKTMAEGAGAAGLAAMLAKPERFRGRKVGLILCGGNIDPRILASDHGARARARRPDRLVPPRPFPTGPACSGQIATRLGELGANILEVDHRRLFLDVPAKGAKLDVTVETRDRAHAEEIMRRCRRRLSAGADRDRDRDGVILPAISGHDDIATNHPGVVQKSLHSRGESSISNQTRTFASRSLSKFADGCVQDRSG